MKTSKPNLEDIDKALAANLDEMMQNGKPVEGLLDEAPNERITAAVPAADHITAAPQAQSSPTAQVEAAAPADHLTERASAAQPISPAAQTVSPPAAAIGEAEAPSAPDSFARPAPTAAVMNREDAPKITVVPITELPLHIPIGVGLPPVIDVSPEPEPEPQLMTMAVHKVGSMKRPALHALKFINAPMRRVPAEYRTALDWLAVSLALWVPIVWVMAVRHSNDHDLADAARSVGESPSLQAPAPIHENSVVKGH